jgi:putative flippase GtrA
LLAKTSLKFIPNLIKHAFTKSKPLTATGSEVLSFAWVGAIGFLVDATILTTLVTGYDWRNYSARLVSFACAVSITWYLNRRWTFKRRATPNKKKEYSTYLMVQSVGAMINYGVFIVLVTTNGMLALIPAIPLAVGSLVAMAFNFSAARAVVYTKSGISH